MSKRHPESFFSSKTWKGENGDQGLRNLYGTFAHLLAIYGYARQEKEKTREQREIRVKAAQINLSRMHNIGARINSGEAVSEEERQVWESVNYDIQKEVLRSRLRAFHISELDARYYPDALSDHQSSMVDIFAYILANIEKLKKWSHYEAIVSDFSKLGISIEQ